MVTKFRKRYKVKYNDTRFEVLFKCEFGDKCEMIIIS